MFHYDRKVKLRWQNLTVSEKVFIILFFKLILLIVNTVTGSGYIVNSVCNCILLLVVYGCIPGSNGCNSCKKKTKNAEKILLSCTFSDVTDPKRTKG